MPKPKTMSASDIEMLKSCFTYSDWGRYYQELLNKYGKRLVDKEEKALRNRYEVVWNTYEDSEGCTYNSLVERK